jgi:hypothetical protein
MPAVPTNTSLACGGALLAGRELSLGRSLRALVAAATRALGGDADALGRELDRSQAATTRNSSGGANERGAIENHAIPPNDAQDAREALL